MMPGGSRKNKMPGKFLPSSSKPQGQIPSQRQPFIAHPGVDRAVERERGMTAEGGQATSSNIQLNLDELCGELSESGVAGSQISQLIAKAVDTALKAALPQIVQVVKEACLNTIKEAINPHLLRIQFQQDEIQQELRRDNLRFTGISEAEEETEEQLIESVAKVAREVGVEIRPEDISSCHRFGKRRDGGRSRQAVVRFLSRRKRDKLYAARFSLKGKDAMKGVYINEDLTAMRHSVFMKAKEAPNIKSVNSRYGNISCKLTNGETRFVKSPDDLFDLGLDNISYSNFKLHFLA